MYAIRKGICQEFLSRKSESIITLSTHPCVSICLFFQVGEWYGTVKCQFRCENDVLLLLRLDKIYHPRCCYYYTRDNGSQLEDFLFATDCYNFLWNVLMLRRTS